MKQLIFLLFIISLTQLHSQNDKLEIGTEHSLIATYIGVSGILPTPNIGLGFYCSYFPIPRIGIESGMRFENFNYRVSEIENALNPLTRINTGFVTDQRFRTVIPVIAKLSLNYTSTSPFQTFVFAGNNITYITKDPENLNTQGISASYLVGAEVKAISMFDLPISVVIQYDYFKFSNWFTAKQYAANLYLTFRVRINGV